MRLIDLKNLATTDKFKQTQSCTSTINSTGGLRSTLEYLSIYRRVIVKSLYIDKYDTNLFI